MSRSPYLPSAIRALRWLLPCLIVSTGSAAAQTPIGLLDAVAQTVALHPEVRVRQDDIAVARADLQEARGQFDTRLTSAFRLQRSYEPQFLQLGLAAESLFYTAHGSLSTYNLVFEKQHRSGLLFRPSVQVDRSAQTFAGLSPTGDAVRLPLPGQNRTILSLQVTQPLMRGRGWEAVTAFEQAATAGVDASASTLRHTVASAVLRTTASYWNYVAALRRQDIVRAAEARAEAMLEETSAIIGADVQPASDLKLVQATLANRRANRIGVEQAAVGARHELVLASGQDPAVGSSLGPPADAVPDPPSSGTLAGSDVEALVSIALTRRADLAAARQRESQLESLTGAARDAVRPDVALTLDAGYVGLRDGRSLLDYLSPLQRMDGFNASAALAYRFPLANQAALGQLARTEATARQNRTSLYDLVRTIRSNVVVAWSDVQATAARVEQARQASALYRSTVEDERLKVRLGLSTVLDLIVTEDRMVQSLLDEVAAETAYAVAVARLRFETGTLIGPGAAGGDITRDRLTTVPAGDGL